MMAVMAVIGLIPTVGAFVVFFMRYEARERWSLVIPYAAVLVIAEKGADMIVMKMPTGLSSPTSTAAPPQVP